MIMVSEKEFNIQLRKIISEYDFSGIKFVTGPGRSGAIAAVYVSHLVGLAFLPYKQRSDFGDCVLIVDTASMSGKTMRRAMNWYKTTKSIICFNETDERHVFWYEKDYTNESGA